MALVPVEATLSIVQACIADLRAVHGVKKLAVMGYCFGGKHCALVAGLGLVDAYGVAHPSFVTLGDFTACTVPGYFACAETDQHFPWALVDETQAALEAAGTPCEFRKYAGTTQRICWDKVVKAREDALLGACSFFAKHLAL
jgi:dienelactone hydrolase